MKGIVFTLLEQVVVDEYDERTWDSLLSAAGLDGVYTAVGSYPDEQLTALVMAASEALKIEPDAVVSWFGRKAIPLFYQRYPAFFEPHPGARSLVLALNDVIHPEVRKLFPGAYVPEFHFEPVGDQGLKIGYVSRRRLCSFAEGLILGSADHFGEEATVTHEMCMKKGDDRCLIVCEFQKKQ